MSSDLVALLYLVAGVLFILALRGLSSPETSRRGNYLGMAGMAIAVVTTLAVARPEEPITWAMIVGGVAIGGGIGAAIARRIPMTAMPELVAAARGLGMRKPAQRQDEQGPGHQIEERDQIGGHGRR